MRFTGIISPQQCFKDKNKIQTSEDKQTFFNEVSPCTVCIGNNVKFMTRMNNNNNLSERLSVSIWYELALKDCVIRPQTFHKLLMLSGEL